ncbi:MAG: DUF3108 domain-containing protein [Bdellovibrionales bacterium]|nr:DUF3108 domain-containing protein [Bdellovibrionales bacterium]NQZ18968.1 DUF3108 domain-containing protein [Bdellovibrionales bacterium]
MKFLRSLSFILGFLFVASCATSDKDFSTASVSKHEEFEKVVKIEKIESEKVDEPEKKEVVKKTSKKSAKKTSKKSSKKPVKKKTKASKEKKAAEKKVEKKPEIVKAPKIKPHLPKLEDGEGFNGRRPLVEPFRVGEEVVLGISYFAVEAGKFTMQVKPMVQVNGKKSYHFRYIIKTSPLFAMFYSVDDIAETFVDYEDWVPYSYEIHVDESKQKRETRTFFDHKKLKATMWDKKKRPNKPLEERKIDWDILKYSQNVFSSAYYLRTFTLKVGKKLKVRVGHEGKNIEMTAEVLRKEKIYTDVGAFDTFVVKPTFHIEGKFKPTGDNFLWLTADERKFIVRMESKIKIGTIVGEIQKLKK